MVRLYAQATPTLPVNPSATTSTMAMWRHIGLLTRDNDAGPKEMEKKALADSAGMVKTEGDRSG